MTKSDKNKHRKICTNKQSGNRREIKTDGIKNTRLYKQALQCFEMLIVSTLFVRSQAVSIIQQLKAPIV